MLSTTAAFAPTTPTLPLCIGTTLAYIPCRDALPRDGIGVSGITSSVTLSCGTIRTT